MRKIDPSKDLSEIYLHVYYALAEFGLHIKAEKLGLLERELWQKKQDNKKLIAAIEAFQWKEIK